MRSIFIAIAAVVLNASAALAYGFESEILGPVTGQIARFDVRVAPELVSDNVTTQPGVRNERLVSTRDAERLATMFEDALRKQYNKRDLIAEDGAPGLTLTATIVTVNTNNPGFTERGFRRNVSPAFSVGRGHAVVEGVVTNADGVEIARFGQEYEELPLNAGLPGDTFVVFGGGLNPRSPWFTARRVFRMFATRSSKELAAALAEADT